MQNNHVERAALFDVDGLMVDSEALWFRIFLETLALRGVHISRDETASFISIQDRVAYEMVRRDKGADFDVEEALAAHSGAYDRRFPYAAIFPGAAEIVRRCRRLGYKTGIVSGSKQKYIDLVLRKIGNDFDVIVNQEDARSKPDPQGYLMAAERLGISPDRCMAFEDSSTGIAAAKAAGMYTVGVRVGSYGKQNLQADYLVATLRQVETPLLRKFGLNGNY